MTSLVQAGLSPGCATGVGSLPFLDADDKRTIIECLFGDEAGRTLGFTPRGLSHWAGLAVALHDARRKRPCVV